MPADIDFPYRARHTTMAGKIPVTVITGFLGSGKTTLIRNLLLNNQGKKIAVLVNEFGELGIDGDLLSNCGICPEDEAPNNIVELTNGCLCCTVQEEFFPAMRELLERRDSLDWIVIETSGLALPKPLVTAFRWPEIRNRATVDAVITLVDAAAVIAGRFATDPNTTSDHETPLAELFEDQLACADLVVVNKTDLIDAADRVKVQSIISQHTSATVKTMVSDRGQVDPAKLLGWEAAVENCLADRPSHHDGEEEHDHDDGVGSIGVTLAECEPTRLQNVLKDLMATQEIYRVKGFVAVPQKAMRMVWQGVGDRQEQFFDRPWRSDEPRLTRLVVIGQDLDEATIRAKLEAAVVVQA
jgi:cobalamin biosynthesis protein CobW